MYNDSRNHTAAATATAAATIDRQLDDSARFDLLTDHCVNALYNAGIADINDVAHYALEFAKYIDKTGSNIEVDQILRGDYYYLVFNRSKNVFAFDRLGDKTIAAHEKAVTAFNAKVTKKKIQSKFDSLRMAKVFLNLCLAYYEKAVDHSQSFETAYQSFHEFNTGDCYLDYFITTVKALGHKPGTIAYKLFKIRFRGNETAAKACVGFIDFNKKSNRDKRKLERKRIEAQKKADRIANRMSRRQYK